MHTKLSLFGLTATLFLTAFTFSPALAAKYYAEQTNFTETSVPVTGYEWDSDSIKSCIYKSTDVNNTYYVWTKLAVQKWRQALREYTDNQGQWNISAHYVKSKAELEPCDIKIYIYGTYKDFPDYPHSTGAYTAISASDGDDQRDIRVYLAPLVLHGDGKTEIDLPTYAFRNSAVHEIGHALGLGHMQSQKGYLMSPQFDFWDEKDQLPITTLELKALVSVYGTAGFG